MLLKDLEKKKILILGFGREGQDTFSFLKKVFPEKTLGVADMRSLKDFSLREKKMLKRTEAHLGQSYLRAVSGYDLVIKTPGISFKNIGLKNRSKFTSQAEIFFDNCPARIIGVTGTKGKSTTSSLIFSILKEARLPVRLVGNIGKPALSSLIRARKNDIFVFELSCHQLQNMKKSPDIAVFLNVFPEHLDYYKNFKEYVSAKANILKYQEKNDFLVYNREDKTVRSLVRLSKAKKIGVKGRYYDLDRAAAKAVGKILDIPDRTIDSAVKKFVPLQHRLEFAGTFKGISFYNDSLATVPEAAIEAMDFLGDKVYTMLLGGFDRGVDFKSLAERISRSRVKVLIFFPGSGKRIWKEIKDKKRFRSFFVSSMEEAVRISFQNTEKGSICLLSPASPSFGLFRDYKDRGDSFKVQVKRLGKSGWN